MDRNKQLEKEQHYAEKLFSLADQNPAAYGYLEKTHQSVIDSIKDQLKKGNSWDGADNSSEGVSYKLFDKWGILDSGGFESKYKINVDLEELEIIEERVNQEYDDSYDRVELTGILNVLSEKGESPSARELRRNDLAPSEVPFQNKFGSLSNAYWCAGLDNDKTEYDRDILVEEYLSELHSENADSDLLVDDPTIGEGGMPSRRVYSNHFEDISQVREEASTQTIAEFYEERKHWHKITHSNMITELDQEAREIDISQFSEIERGNLLPLFPQFKAKQPRVDSLMNNRF